jgi:hypothetical protein
MMYFGVVHDDPRRRRADHRLAQPEAVQRHQDGAAGGAARSAVKPALGEIRDMIVQDTLLPLAATPGQHHAAQTSAFNTSETGDVVHRPRRHQAPSPWCSTPAAGWPDWWLPCSSISFPARRRKLCFDIDGDVSQPTRPNPAHRGEPARHHAEVIRQKADVGIRVGRRRRPLLLHRRQREFISGDFITALPREAFLLKHPGLHDHLRPARQPRREGHVERLAAGR